jgi:aspartyl-tRNA(Asn)/glutamyl-tRNA(Gln) amidotransferase subunit B
MVVNGKINQGTAKTVLSEMFATGKPAANIVSERGLGQISDAGLIQGLVQKVLAESPEQVAAYLAGKDALLRWLFGQVMRTAQGKANPQVLQAELERQLAMKASQEM